MLSNVINNVGLLYDDFNETISLEEHHGLVLKCKGVVTNLNFG